MDKSVQAFLQRGSLDPQDLIAKRAIRAYLGLTNLLANANDRGDSVGFAEVARGIDCALYAFACVNTAKSYDFAGAVHPLVPGLTEGLLDLHNQVEKSKGLLQQAEAVYAALKDILTPVCAIRGPLAWMILRGDHCRAAMAGVSPVNDN